jgi:transcriptional regulator NrdR family protein
MPSTGDSRPVPDPTALTTEQLHREIGALREFVLGEIQHVREISQVKFAAVEREFATVAERTAEQKTDTKDALDAALRAAKDAVALQTVASDKAIAKSEFAVTKVIDGLVTQMDKSAEVMREQLNDLKQRVGGLETTTKTKDEGSTKASAVIALVISAILVIVSVIVAANALTG